jgi:hypothetical protein
VQARRKISKLNNELRNWNREFLNFAVPPYFKFFSGQRAEFGARAQT